MKQETQVKTICVKCGVLTTITHQGCCFNCILALREEEKQRERPEVKAKQKAYHQRPEQRAKQKAKHDESRRRRLTPKW